MNSVPPPRRSARIRALHGTNDSNSQSKPIRGNQEKVTNSKSQKQAPTSKRSAKETVGSKKKSKTSKSSKPMAPAKSKTPSSLTCLPRDIEQQVLNSNDSVQFVLGIDEAGRGPLAGPVVAAAVIPPQNIEGVVDSKKITKEEDREDLYERLVGMQNIQWAVSIIDAQRIDEINILQATLEGMQKAATALVCPAQVNLPMVSEASITRSGCYVVVSDTKLVTSEETVTVKEGSTVGGELLKDNRFYALIDGNKVPKQMPCDSESVIKGDSKEFCIAAASILAKVTRDRLMHGYDELYPHYNLKQHKGYPTAHHMKAVTEHGASPIHRRTFAPLKHMKFDAQGKILKEE